MKKIAFVTQSQPPIFTEDDCLVVDILQTTGIEVQLVAWDDAQVAWEQFDQIIMRSCWDYHLRIREFTDWLEALQERGCSTCNSIPVLQWNLHKKYLQHLQRRSVAVPPTVWLEKNARVDLMGCMQQNNWHRAVVKPAISASGHQTLLVLRENAASHQERLNHMLQAGDVLVQKFMEEISSQGEWSLVFFHREYSHAVLKSNRRDFRVQAQYGGSVTSLQPPESMIREAEYILGLIEEPLLYARVDAIEVDGTCVLMEIELIEPVLFLSTHAGSARVFADAITRAIHDQDIGSTHPAESRIHPRNGKDTRTHPIAE